MMMNWKDRHIYFSLKKYRKLKDYLGQRAFAFLSRCYVDRSELNPLINTMLDNYIKEIGKEYTRTL